MKVPRWIEGHYESDEDQTLRERAESAEAEVERLRAIISPGDAAAFEEHMAAREAHWVAQIERLRVIIDAIGKDAEADRTVLDQQVALAKIRSRVGNVQRAALRRGGE